MVNYHWSWVRLAALPSWTCRLPAQPELLRRQVDPALGPHLDGGGRDGHRESNRTSGGGGPFAEGWSIGGVLQMHWRQVLASNMMNQRYNWEPCLHIWFQAVSPKVPMQKSQFRRSEDPVIWLTWFHISKGSKPFMVLDGAVPWLRGSQALVQLVYLLDLSNQQIVSDQFPNQCFVPVLSIGGIALTRDVS